MPQQIIQSQPRERALGLPVEHRHAVARLHHERVLFSQPQAHGVEDVVGLLAGQQAKARRRAHRQRRPRVLVGRNGRQGQGQQRVERGGGRLGVGRVRAQPRRHRLERVVLELQGVPVGAVAEAEDMDARARRPGVDDDGEDVVPGRGLVVALDGGVGASQRGLGAEGVGGGGAPVVVGLLLLLLVRGS